MTSTLLKKVERFRYLAILLLAVCGYATADAQLSSDEISEAILVEGSVPVKWTNDAEHPWYIPEGESYIRTPETEEDFIFTTSITFSYSSAYPTELTWEWTREHYSNGDVCTLVIDGEPREARYSTSWTSEYGRWHVPAGDHTIQFISTSEYSYYHANNWGGIRNLRVWECKELEKSCLAEGSLPITFENEENPWSMWVTEGGYIRSAGYREADSTTKFSTTITVDTPSLFAFEWRNLRDYSYYSEATVYVDGLYYSFKHANAWNTESIVLYPGTHTIEFRHWSRYGDGRDIVEIRNVTLHQNWYEVTLNNPGELGTRLTQVLEGKPIQDMELLKIKGAMNSDDWSSIKLLTGIKGIDFSQTSITNIPASACEDLQYLSTVILPETLTGIGDKAFMGTNFYQIAIPASVEGIGSDVWNGTPLRYISFAKDSKLSYIGCSAFYRTRIMEFDMPDSVETLGTYDYYVGGMDYYDGYYHGYVSSLFYGCTDLKRLHLSTQLKGIPGLMANGCTSLEEVNMPENVDYIDYYAFNNTALKSIDLPATLRVIGRNTFSESSIESVIIPKNVTIMCREAFSGNTNLKEVHLNSYCWDMDNTFSGCTALEKVVLPCATPPTISSDYYGLCDPFSGVNKEAVTLVVPDFAFDTYRANSYWYNFKNTVKGDEASINDYWAIRGTLNLNSTLVMQGNPSVEMMENSKLTLDSNSAQTFNEFTYNTSESSPAIVLSKSNSVKADKLVSKFYVENKDKWYFFSPITDVKMSDISYPATDSWVIRYYDGARRASEDASSGNWVNVPADGTLKGGQGYIIQAREAGWLYLPAASTAENDKFFGANEVTFDLADNACETEANAGWNFVANPYPTYYDIYYIDMQAPITVWTGSTYKAYSLNDGDRGDDTFVLRPMQPFFVQKSAETPDLYTGMPLVGRQVNTTIDRSRAPRPVVKDENRQKLNLELYCNDNETADDYTRVVLNEQASLAYESVRDASKFMSMDANVAQLYTLGEKNHPMAINERPYEDGNVALGVLLPSADRTYRISAPRADRKAWLYDAETGIETDLTDGDYIFCASKTGIDNSRFSIRFAPASTTSVEGIEEAIKVAGNIGSISVNAPVGATIAVFGTDASVIANTVAENGTLEIPVASGVYVVKVNGESFKTIVK